LKNAQNISKNDIFARNIALKEKARELLGDPKEDKRDILRDRNDSISIQEVEVRSHRAGLAIELEACRAENEALLAMRSRLCQSNVSSSSTFMKTQNITKNDIFAQNIALEEKARELLGDPKKGKRDIVRGRNDLISIQEMEDCSHREELAIELEARRAENEALRAENEALRSEAGETDVCRFSSYKPVAVEDKVTLELEACRAENNVLRAQALYLLGSRHEDTSERRLDAMTMSQLTLSQSFAAESQAKTAAGEVQSLRDENVRLRVGAQRDSERIEKLVEEVWALIRAAKSCRPPAKGTATFSVGSTASWSVGSSAGSASFVESIDEMRSAGLSVGASIGASVESLVEVSVGSSVGSTAGSPVESPVKACVVSSAVVTLTGSSARLRGENACLREGARRGTKRIKSLEDQVRMLRVTASGASEMSAEESLKSWWGCVEWVGSAGT
jgi:hypothetical protein